MFSKFEFDGKLNPTFVERTFKLPLSSIRAYLKEPITPRFVHLGFAGVTRPDRPGLDLNKQPPVVRLNKELDFILTFKLKDKISREEVAQICVAALESPYASGKTFEVKSVVPFSEPFTVDPQYPPPREGLQCLL
ncbi:PREDICTED: uncharacterized protein LOC103330068 [Prunus mume]|uniref:Uncharacterized protein LOC103330068 n=1 Tax=Prunus mume TaxID=102107 RepID=A0ABM0NWG2_PRUMU|nr:PREDICTED: uncharacterized protein LOC103330068 [Prunus mume]XP_016649194.1 PREDICTED: uncharacterized protein LOC103330068 [Prunus mume]